jgi:hypothetical protein
MKMRTFQNSARAAISAVAITMGLATLPAAAQTMPMGPHGQQGPGAQGAAAGETMAIIHLRNRLNLTADQSAALDAIIANAKTQAAALRTAAQPTVAQIKAELAKAQPSLQVISSLRDSLQPQQEALRKSIRDQLIGFYGTLNATQQQVVIDHLRKVVAFREARAALHLGQ